MVDGGDHRGPRIARIAIGVFGAAAALGIGSCLLAYVATHPPRRWCRRRRDADGLPAEHIEFPSRDGVRLSGWFVPAPETTVLGGVILCHGYQSERSELLPLARALHAAGLHLLLFDFRRLGASGGDLCTIGAHEVRDLLGAVDYFAARPEMAGLPLAAFGNSMGGAVSIMAAAQDGRIRAVATHGAYATLDRAVAQLCRTPLGPFGRLLHVPMRWWGTRLWLPCDPREVAPVRVISRIAPRPVLLAHGAHDVTVNPADAKLLYRAAGEPRELVVLHRSWHFWVHPSERGAFQARVVRFFVEALAGEAQRIGVRCANPISRTQSPES